MRHPEKNVFADGFAYREWGFHRHPTEDLTKHRLDGPAVEYNNGNKSWFVNGELVAMQVDEHSITVGVRRAPLW